jgi:prepilin-type N-terminal cleavage/methylation domain-containing protein
MARGFTLIELIIVLAIVAIVGAILIPNFLNTTDRARLRGDIQSARVLQNALDLYNLEQPEALTSLDNLYKRGYVDEKKVAVQTKGAAFELKEGAITLNISGTREEVRTVLFNQLSQLEKQHVTGGTGE